ncbi:MAG: peptide-binding protein [Candidatus Rokubacteria bacterium]|nr:peptide-binding protein [Candidatus Rokubacteria bacterium]
MPEARAQREGGQGGAPTAPAEPAQPPPPVPKPPSYGDALVEGSIGDASNLIPILAADSASHNIGGLIYNGLVKYDRDLNIVGDLAESWQVSPDGLTLTFRLRRGVRWHDGHPLTAEDVHFTYRVLVDRKTPTAYAEDFLQVAKAEVLDPHTFRVRYRQPYAKALISWAVSILPRHRLEGQDLTKTPLARRPVGTGPYRFVEWKTGEKIVLEANPDYFEGRPFLDRYVYRIIPDQATMFLELKARSLDMMGLTPLQYARQTTRPELQARFRRYRYAAFAYTYLGYNLRHPLFRDRRVRQAISYAIDQQELIQGVLLGLGQSATGPYRPGTWAYNPHVQRYPHDPERARALLREAGWRDTDGDGILDWDGRPFAFTILTNQGNESRAKTAELIQWRLRKVGIAVKIRTVEWAAFVNEFLDKRRFEAVVLGWRTGQDPDLYNVWHSSKTGPKQLNFIGFRHPEVDRLLEQGRRTLDRTERKRSYDAFQAILAEEQPYTFLYVPDALTIVHSRVRGIEPAPAGLTYNFIRWYVPRDEQLYAALVP